MGEAFLIHSSLNYAVVRVYSEGRVYCKASNSTAEHYDYSRMTSDGYADFALPYGEWTFFNDYYGIEKRETIEINSAKMHYVHLDRYVFGIYIDMDARTVEYIEDAANFQPLSCDIEGTGKCDYGSWKTIITDFIGCKPCTFLNGKVYEYLNPDNYNFTVSGSERKTSVMMSTSSGRAMYPLDVMVEFKKLWYKFDREENSLIFKISNYDHSDNLDEYGTWSTTAFTSLEDGSTICDFMYYAAYDGSMMNGGSTSGGSYQYICSVSGPTINNDNNSGIYNFTDCNENVLSRHDSYGTQDLARRCYILGLCMLVTRSNHLGLVIGSGLTSSNVKSVSHGSLDSMGLFAGFKDNTKSVKCFGIENMWGLAEFCNGVILKNDSDEVLIEPCGTYDMETGKACYHNLPINNPISFLLRTTYMGILLDMAQDGPRFWKKSPLAYSIFFPAKVSADGTIGFGGYVSAKYTEGEQNNITVVGAPEKIAMSDSSVYTGNPFTIRFGEPSSDNHYCRIIATRTVPEV